jgi:hypothetical protein
MMPAFFASLPSVADTVWVDRASSATGSEP